jgi:diguanylate cyclase (GGDEF)-like protein
MAHPTDSILTHAAIPPPVSGLAATEQRMSELTTLLRELEVPASSGTADSSGTDAGLQNQLLHVRLGVASSMFAALQCRHAATAAHSLRVTLVCSAWSSALGLPSAERDELEVAALFHDLGKIGVPDSILLKPAPLSPDEIAIMSRQREMMLKILSHSCNSPAIFEIAGNSGAWYNGGREGYAAAGEALPLGARVLAIADAFDAMTTDQVYRRAMSHERALNELYRCSGTQFDPELVRRFSELQQFDVLKLQQQAARAWLQDLDPGRLQNVWRLNHAPTGGTVLTSEELFQEKLLDNMYDAVVFIDSNLQVLRWNRAAERLTGIQGESVYQQRFVPSLLAMCDEDGTPISDGKCPINFAIRSGVQWLRRLTIRGRGARVVSVDAHAVPVFGQDGGTYGATLLLHDASSEITLERRCQNLHERATKDPLTQVANRAEFDKMHAAFVITHQSQGFPCSLIVSDIDHFKRVNDTYGHQAGDAVLKNFATLLSNGCRPGDLVARYGGEEFVMLCADCDIAGAFRRAEEIRLTLADIPQPALGSKRITASFGVTEAQPGDTPETMLRRADRALYQAKGQGRNAVVQLGSGAESDGQPSTGQPPKAKESNGMTEVMLVTTVPLNVSIEKLRGFVSDQHAELLTIDGNCVRLRIEGAPGGEPLRRGGDRPVWFVMELHFEQEFHTSGDKRGQFWRTRIHVTAAPQKNRDRRRQDSLERGEQLLISLRSYLMADVESLEYSPPQPGTLRKVAQLLNWLKK